MIRSSSIAVGSILGLTNISSGKTTNIKDFNPDDREEVKIYVDEYKPINNPDTEKHLTKSQQQAILDYYADVEWDFEVEDENVDVVSSNKNELVISPRRLEIPASTTIKAIGSTGVTREYTFKATFEWMAHGDGHGYSNVSTSSTGWSNALAAEYVARSRTHGVMDSYSSYFHAWEHGQFSLELYADWRTVTAKIKIRGDEMANHSVLRKGAPL